MVKCNVDIAFMKLESKTRWGIFLHDCHEHFVVAKTVAENVYHDIMQGEAICNIPFFLKII